MTKEVSNRIDDALQAAAAKLEAVSESAMLDAELLLCQSINLPRSYLFAHPDDVLDNSALERFDALIRRRLDEEPMSYIIGTKEFWSMELMVSPATLVPRPETELLVDLALREIPRKANWQLLDLGTGSGAIAIALARERPLCEVTATDISPSALAIASENARQHSLGNIAFLEGDWTAPVQGCRFDLIVSNPPYVRAQDSALTKLRHEPIDALRSGADGLQAIRTLAADCVPILKPGGRLLVEHGFDQASSVKEILEANGWQNIACHTDYSGHPRVTAAEIGGK